MKGLVIVAFCVALAVVVWAHPEDKYTDKYDSVDIDEILKNDRLLNNYVECLKTGKKCTPEGEELRANFEDALQNKCSKCTDVQKTQSKKVIRFLAKNKPQIFKELEEQYDHDRKYRTVYADELKAEGIVLPD